MSEVKKVSEAEYLHATDSYLGWCSTCGEFTREATEPDAEGYDCPKCEGLTVMGAEQALLTGLITVEDDNG